MSPSVTHRTFRVVLGVLVAVASVAPVGGVPSVADAASGDWGVTELWPVSTGSLALMPLDLDSQTPDMSADGRWVAFGSFASVLVEGDGNGEQDVFLYDRQSGTTRRASVKSDGTEVDAGAAYPTVSDDGQRVTFDTNGQFTANDTNTEYDCYVHDFVSSETTLVSQTPGGLAGNGYSGSSMISADGNSVAFSSGANNIIAGDGNGVGDIFVRDLASGETTRASVTDADTEANGYSWSPSISGDGSRVAFGSAATNLVVGDTNGYDDIYVRDLVAGSTVRASLADDGSEPDGSCGVAMISDDGRYVLFESDATNLIAGGTDGSYQFFLRDLQDSSTELISQSTAGVVGNGSYQDAFVSADGSYVVFSSDANNLVADDTNNRSDVFMRDRIAGTTTLVSVASGGAQANEGCYSPAVSADGQTVAFHSAAESLGADTGGWTYHVYVRDIGADVTGSIISSALYTTMGNGYSTGASIASDGSAVAYSSSAQNLVADDTNSHADVFVSDITGGGTVLASKGPGGVAANGDSGGPALSGDGSAVAFQSYASNLVADDTNGVTDVFVADVEGGAVARVSVSSAGVEGNGESGDSHISANGRRVTFASDATNLVSGDTNSVQDAFVRDLAAGTTVRVSVSTGGDQPDYSVWSPRISGNGRYVTFHSQAGNLVAGDDNNADDVFIHDTQTSETVRGSLGEGGVQLDGNSGHGALSYDGRLLAFASRATNVISGVAGSSSHVYVRDLDTGAVTLVSKHSDGTPGNGSSYNPVLSVDGRYVTFMSVAQNLVDGYTYSNYHVFVHDLQTGETVLLDTAPGGPQANAAGLSPSISGDGSLVAFETAANNLYAQDNNNTTDIYVARLGSLVPVDTKAPETTPYGVPGSWVSEDVTVTLEATDTPAPDEYASGVAGIRYSVAGSAVATYTEPIEVTAEGTTLIRYSAIDNAGNAEETQTATVRIDKSVPTVGDNAPAGWSKTNVSVTLTANDAHSGVDAILYDLGSGEVTYTAPIVVSAEGVTDIAYRAIDNVGLSSAAGEATVRIDKTAPATTDNARGLYYGSAAITLAPSDALSGVAQTRWTLDGGAPYTGTAVNVPAAGQHTLSYWSVDGAGNAETPKNVTFKVLSAGRTDVAGSTRFTTGVEASKRAFPEGAGTVVLATGRNWPDALGGSALAGAVDGPLMLVDTNSVPSAVLAEIGRLGATKAYILGGEAAVSAAVKTQLEGALGAGRVVRLAGNTRYATARAVANEAIRLEGPDFTGDAFVVTGENFPDALGASPISSAKVRPILLVKPDGMPSMPPQVRRVVILGGQSAVSDVTEAALKSTLGNVNVDRKGGKDRYETAALVADYCIAQGMKWDGVGLATGADFPDALSGGAMLGSLDTVMLLTKPLALNAHARTRLQANTGTITTWHYIGGAGALSNAVRVEVDAIVGK